MLGVLNGLTPGTEATTCARPHSGTRFAARDRVLAAEARRQGQVLTAILHIDTGMSRLGLDAAELSVRPGDPGLLAGIALRYVMTHLASSERRGDPKNDAPAKVSRMPVRTLRPAPRSIANSSGIFLGPRFGSDLARPGAALYGINPTPGRVNPMRPVARLRARPASAHICRRAQRSATCDLDGRPGPAGSRPRASATRMAGCARSQVEGAAIFDERVVPLVGRVSMDLHVRRHRLSGRVPGRVAGSDRAGADRGCCRGRGRTNGYEVLTSLGRRSAGRIWS